ncbi:MAG: hypothetical protein R3A13_04670 [Bdellovibrionota bacterium]
MSEKVSSRLKRYRRSERRQQFINYTAMGIGAIFFMTSLVLALTGNFDVALNAVGIQSVDESGVYIDCSLRKNKTNRYCQTNTLSQSDKDWRDLRNSGASNKGQRKKSRGGAFSLINK